MSGPRTTTAEAFVRSAEERNRPEVTPRERTADQLGVVPVRVVVQLVEPTTSDADVVDVGATDCTSGAVAGAARASASCCVSVDAEPKPPRVPVVEVELPGETTRMLVPSSLIWSCTLAFAPFPMPTVRTTAVMPMRMPSVVSAERSRCVRTASVAVRSVSRQVIGRIQTVSSRVIASGGAPRPPSRISILRSARAAMSCSCVMRTMVLPSSLSAPSSSSTSAVEVESRFPVGSSARMTAGWVTSARAMATRCC